MKEDLALKILSHLMKWDDERARKEFAWLRLMSRLKYDGYRDFQAGMRFIESLAVWLQQFQPTERDVAYSFVRNTLTFIGPSEMRRLVEQFYPRHVRERLQRIVAAECGIEFHQVLATSAGEEAYKRLVRQTLFMGLSDGARIDVLRHSNIGRLSNEQLVIDTQLDTDKWEDLLASLRNDLNDQTARFRQIYLIDDFVGTGTTLSRYNSEKRKWAGKLFRFLNSLNHARNAAPDFLTDNWGLCIHHYICSASAKEKMTERLKEATHQSVLPTDINLSFGMILPANFPLSADRDSAFVSLTETYYDPSIRTKHTDVGGATHLGLGYGGCALPLVLEHNTPNNSIALLWAETTGGASASADQKAHPMRPLFRRRQRHL